MPADNRPLVTANRFLVIGLANERIGIQGLPEMRPLLTHDDALALAAWLVAMVGDRERFARVLAAIERT